MSKKRKKGRFDPSRYEGFSYGPIRVERFGRLVRIRSEWEPGQFEKFRESVKNRRSEFKIEIDQKVAGLLSLIQEFDPMQLLSVVSIRNCFADPETYRETTHEGRECYVEYAQSLILGREHNPDAKDATKEAIDQFNTLIAGIFSDITWYFSTEVTEGKRTETEEEIRFTSLLHYLFVRGDSFPEHHLEMIRNIFADQDPFLQRHYGFTSGQVISSINHVEQQLLANLRQDAEMMGLLRELHEIFKRFSQEEHEQNFDSIDELRDRYQAFPGVRERMERLDGLRNNADESPFEVTPDTEAPQELLTLLSSRLGDNAAFLMFPKSPGWPTNDSIVYERPLLVDAGRFYCFMPQLLFRNLGGILERWIQRKDPHYYDGTYQKSRAKYLEDTALKYLSKMLPGAQVVGKVYYNVERDGNRERVETDGLVLYDENIFIVEAKAGTLSMSSRRGSLEQIRRDMAELVDGAYAQALRAKEYIRQAPEPIFEFADGSTAIVIKNKDIYKNIFLVNVTLQNLASLATKLNSLKAWNLIAGQEWPWSVFINDLRVISELIEFPSEFLHFLQLRLRVNDYPQFEAADELDFLMLYLSQGLYLDEKHLGQFTAYSPFGYTEDLDRWYDYAAGRVSSGEKPHLRIPEEYKRLITDIEATDKQGFTKVTTFLLGLDRKTQRQMLENLKKAELDSKRDGRDRDFTMYFSRDKLGLMFSIGTKRSPDFNNKMDNHCRLKMYQTHFEEWLLITVDTCEDGTRALDFRVYAQKWEHNPAMEAELERFKQWKWAQRQKEGRKIGRNTQCRCGSGLKYKRCCGK